VILLRLAPTVLDCTWRLLTALTALRSLLLLHLAAFTHPKQVALVHIVFVVETVLEAPCIDRGGHYLVCIEEEGPTMATEQTWR
jgi:hypothetical protein